MSTQVKLPTVQEVRAAYSEFLATGAKIEKIGTMIDALCDTITAVQALDKATGSVKATAINKSLESILCNAEKQMQMASVEGLGEAIKNGFVKLLEYIKKACLAIRDFIGKLFNTTGFMARTIEANKDKLDFEKVVKVPDYASVEEMVAVGTELSMVAHAWVAKLSGIKSFKDVGLDEVNIEDPLEKRVKQLALKHPKLLQYNEDTGKVSTEFTVESKEQSLSAGGYTPDKLIGMISYRSPFPQVMNKIGEGVFKYQQALTNFNLDVYSAPAEAAAGVVSDKASEQVTKIVNKYRLWWNCMYSSISTLISWQRYIGAVTQQAFSTLPADVKKRF